MADIVELEKAFADAEAIRNEADAEGKRLEDEARALRAKRQEQVQKIVSAERAMGAVWGALAKAKREAAGEPEPGAQTVTVGQK